MKTIQIEVPEGKKAEWVNGVLTLVDDQPIVYKYKVGDKVKVVHHNDGLAYEVVKQGLCDGEPAYYIKHNDLVELCYERFLKPFSEDITERIKTLDDACKWCEEHGAAGLVAHYEDWEHYRIDAFDIIAYLKLRIITCALNEGWEPMMDESEFRFSYYSICGKIGVSSECSSVNVPATLVFKSMKLAEYATKRFADIYADFLGIKKGGEK